MTLNVDSIATFEQCENRTNSYGKVRNVKHSFKLLTLSVLTLGCMIAFALGYAVTFPIVSMTFTEFMTAHAPQMFSLVFMILSVGAAMFFQPKIESFLENVLMRRLDRYDQSMT